MGRSMMRPIKTTIHSQTITQYVFEQPLSSTTIGSIFVLLGILIAITPLLTGTTDTTTLAASW